jgi:GNAT superfamily N-acetyltransferase
MIRPLLVTDRAAWLELWSGYQAFYQVEIAPSVTDTTWRRLLDPAEPMHCAVKEEDGRVVGIVHFIFHRSTWTEGDYCYLQDLFMSPPARGRGFARQLIEHVYAQAAARQASRVYWLTHESNTTAMLLYDKIAQRSGFVQYRKNLV